LFYLLSKKRCYNQWDG